MNYWIAISKVLLEGLAVSFAAYFITSRQTDLSTVIMIGLTAALTFLILDYFAPEIGLSARQGSGFGIGFTRLSGFQLGGAEEEGKDLNHKKMNNQVNKALTENHTNRQVECQSQKLAEYQGNNHLDMSLTNSIERCQLSKKINSQVEQLPPFHSTNQLSPITQCPAMTHNMAITDQMLEQSLTPINQNVDEYKVLPGIYSKYYLRASGAPLTPIH